MGMGRRAFGAYAVGAEHVAAPRPVTHVWSWPQSRVLTTLLLASALVSVFLYGLNSLPLGSLNEGLYTECAREMIETGQWLTPRINTIVYWEKPPLLYWTVALSLRAFGYSELAARLPSALALAATCLITFLFAAKLYGRGVGWLSLGIMVAAPYFITQQQLVMFDGLLAFFFASAVFSFYLGMTDRRWYLLAALALGLAVMTKGFIALFLFVPLVLLYRWLSGQRLNLGYAAWAGPLIFLAIVAPWHIHEAVTQPGFAWFYFINEHILRFLGRKVPADFHRGSFYDPALRAMLLMLPWGIFLIPAVVSSVRRRHTDLLPLLWFAVPLIFFSVSTAKASYYMVIAAPAMAMMIALFLRRNQRSPWLAGTAAVLGCLALVAAFRFGAEPLADQFEALRSGVTMQIISLFAVALLLTASLSGFGKHRQAAFALSVMMLALRLGSFQLCAPLMAWNTEKTVAQPLAALLQRAPRMPQVILDRRLENHSSFIFYLPPQARPLQIADGRWGDLWYGSFFEHKDRLFISPEQAWQMVNGNRAVYCMLKKHVPAGASVICSGGDLAVVAGPQLARSLLRTDPN